MIDALLNDVHGIVCRDCHVSYVAMPDDADDECAAPISYAHVWNFQPGERDGGNRWKLSVRHSMRLQRDIRLLVKLERATPEINSIFSGFEFVLL